MRAPVIVLIIVLVAVAVGAFLFIDDSPTSQASAGEMAGTTEAAGAAPLARWAEPGGAASTPARGLTGFTDALTRRIASDKGPRAPTPDQVRTASAIVELFNTFDLEAAGEVYEDPSIGMEEWFTWLRDRVGECGEGEPMVVRDESQARYIYPCEHGELEVGFKINPETGKVPGLIMGARNVALADPVREAAEAVMRLYDEWDPALFRSTFSDKFDEEEIRRFLLDVRSERGACTLGEPDLVSVRGTLIHLNCERGVRLMKVELLQQEDRIRTLWIRDPRPHR